MLCCVKLHSWRCICLLHYSLLLSELSAQLGDVVVHLLFCSLTLLSKVVVWQEQNNNKQVGNCVLLYYVSLLLTLNNTWAAYLSFALPCYHILFIVLPVRFVLSHCFLLEHDQQTPFSVVQLLIELIAFTQIRSQTSMIKTLSFQHLYNSKVQIQ